MRISVRENDPGYQADAHSYSVALDGAKLEHCFTADEETGEAWVYERDERGHFIVDQLTGLPAEKKLTGIVVVHNQ